MNPVTIDAFRTKSEVVVPEPTIEEIFGEELYSRPVPIRVVGRRLLVTHLTYDKELCANCGTHKDITIDHIVPLWLMRRVQMFGFQRPWLPDESKNISKLCKKCNSEKGSSIPWEHPVAREFMKGLADHIYRQLNEAQR